MIEHPVLLRLLQGPVVGGTTVIARQDLVLAWSLPYTSLIGVIGPKISQKLITSISKYTDLYSGTLIQDRSNKQKFVT